MVKQQDAFVLPCKQYRQDDNFPKVRVSKETYERAAKMAGASGLSMSAILGKALEYAQAHLIYVEE